MRRAENLASNSFAVSVVSVVSLENKGLQKAANALPFVALLSGPGPKNNLPKFCCLGLLLFVVSVII